MTDTVLRPEIDLTGKVALVTGGSRGIGAATARGLAARGARVTVTYSSSAAQADALVKAIEAAGGKAEARRADAADPAQVAAAVADIADRHGRLDILVNAAGVFGVGPVEATDDAEFDRQIAVNVRGTYVAVREAARRMGAGGRIVNVGSVIGGRAGMPGLSIYALSKAAVATATKAWARDLAEKGITVNAVQPGPIDTEMNPASGDFAPVLTAQTALKRYGTAQEVAAAILFLTSPEASYVTGAILNVDGGYEA